MKQSGMIKNVRTAYKNGYIDGMDFQRQLSADFALVVLMERFHWNRDKVLEFYNEMADLNDEFGKIFSEDTKDKEYAKAVLDRKLEKLAGDKFLPWEARYDS